MDYTYEKRKKKMNYRNRSVYIITDKKDENGNIVSTKRMSVERKEGKKEYDAKRVKNDTKSYIFRLPKNNEDNMRIIEHLEKQESFTKYIKSLILDDIDKNS